MTPNIPLLGWSPDSDPTQPGVLVDVENMIPTRRGYAPEAALGASPSYTVTATSQVCGAQTVDTVSAPFFATATNIYAWRGLFQVASRSGTPYTPASVANPWRFSGIVQGTDAVVLAVQFENTLQATTNYLSTNFSDVAGAPKASTIAVQRNFVILGACTTAAGYFSDSWFCSAIEDYTDWTPDIATQCATGRLTATPGDIVRLIAFRDYVIAFKRKSFYRGTYVGAAQNTWEWPVVSRSVGLISHDAVCEAEGVLYWLGYDGFYRWGGGSVERIASAPWEQTQTNFLALGSASETQAQCVWDPVQRVVRFAFTFGESDTARYCFTYHVDTDRWGRVNYTGGNWMFTLPNVSVRMQPQGVYAYTNYATAHFIKTSETSYVLSVPMGSGMLSSFTTGDIGDDEQTTFLSRVRLRFLRPPESSSATHLHRMNIDDPLTTGQFVSRTQGKYDLGDAARWHRIRFTQTGTYEVTGLRVEAPRAGTR